MSERLEGGAMVCPLRQGFPWERGTVSCWQRFGRAQGSEAISLRILECGPGRSPRFEAAGCDEVLYVLEGAGQVLVDGHAAAVEPDTGVFVAEGRAWAADNPGPGRLLLASSRCPEPREEPAPDLLPPGSFPPEAGGEPPPVSRLSEQPRKATGDRFYYELLDHRSTGARVTQFVGCIPPGRAPDHHHDYEEVIVLRSGEGRLWAGASSAPIGPGSCIFLPRGQVHCLENTGSEPMVLLGVFYPAGSPAARVED